VGSSVQSAKVHTIAKEQWPATPDASFSSRPRYLGHERSIEKSEISESYHGEQNEKRRVEAGMIQLWKQE
jgi:hypothetical protein